jgi:hypothetical protein
MRPSELLAELHEERQRQWALQDRYMAQVTAQICLEIREARAFGIVPPLDLRDDDQKDHDEYAEEMSLGGKRWRRR